MQMLSIWKNFLKSSFKNGCRIMRRPIRITNNIVPPLIYTITHVVLIAELIPRRLPVAQLRHLWLKEVAEKVPTPYLEMTDAIQQNVYVLLNRI